MTRELTDRAGVLSEAVCTRLSSLKRRHNPRWLLLFSRMTTQGLAQNGTAEVLCGTSAFKKGQMPTGLSKLWAEHCFVQQLRSFQTPLS
jgi:hypothetical protein